MDGQAGKDQEEYESTKKSITKKTGYEPREILKAPVKPPEIKETKKPTEKQFGGFLAGSILILLGILLLLFSFWIGVVFMLAGAVVASYSVLVRLA